MRKFVLSLIIAALSLTVLAQNAAQPDKPKGKLGGVWRFSISEPDKPAVRGKVSPNGLWFIDNNGPTLTIMDMAGGTTTQGSTSQKHFAFKSPAKVWLEDSASWDGLVVSDSQISGTATTSEGKKVQWTAFKLAAVWECSNHSNPTHVATNEEEMRNLTTKNQCEGWHKVNSSQLSTSTGAHKYAF